MPNLFDLFRRPNQLSQFWLRQQERRDMRIDFEGVAWNWNYLKALAKRKRCTVRRAEKRRCA